MKPEVSLRAMSQADIPAGLRLCRASLWNQVAEDWRCFLELDGGGCILAEKNGKAVGTVAFLRYRPSFSWIAMMLVDPEERGAGIGSQLLTLVLDCLRDQACVRLDATPAGEPLYRRFLFVPEYPLVRAKVVASGQRLGPVGQGARFLEPEDLPAVLALDRRIFGADRGALLTRFHTGTPWFCSVAMERESLLGYCFGRQGYLYNHLGPVVAESLAVARALVSHSLAAHDGMAFAMDVPQSAPDWIGWMESVGFQVERPFLRMRRGHAGKLGEPEWQFGIAGPEFA